MHQSSDSEDRLRDFLSRHGGAASIPSRQETLDEDTHGWSEIYAADGYKLRCEWSREGSHEEMKFSEIPPDRA
jgi:hypothetical protein